MPGQKSKPQPNIKIPPTTKPKQNSKTKPRAKPQPNIKPPPTAKSQPGVKPQTKTKPQPNIKPHATSKPQPKTKSQPPRPNEAQNSRSGSHVKSQNSKPLGNGAEPNIGNKEMNKEIQSIIIPFIQSNVTQINIEIRTNNEAQVSTRPIPNTKPLKNDETRSKTKIRPNNGPRSNIKSTHGIKVRPNNGTQPNIRTHPKSAVRPTTEICVVHNQIMEHNPTSFSGLFVHENIFKLMRIGEEILKVVLRYSCMNSPIAQNPTDPDKALSLILTHSHATNTLLKNTKTLKYPENQKKIFDTSNRNHWRVKKLVEIESLDITLICDILGNVSEFSCCKDTCWDDVNIIRDLRNRQSHMSSSESIEIDKAKQFNGKPYVDWKNDLDKYTRGIKGLIKTFQLKGAITPKEQQQYYNDINSALL